MRAASPIRSGLQMARRSTSPAGRVLSVPSSVRQQNCWFPCWHFCWWPQHRNIEACAQPHDPVIAYPRRSPFAIRSDRSDSGSIGWTTLSNANRLRAASPIRSGLRMARRSTSPTGRVLSVLVPSSVRPHERCLPCWHFCWGPQHRNIEACAQPHDPVRAYPRRSAFAI